LALQPFLAVWMDLKSVRLATKPIPNLAVNECVAMQRARTESETNIIG